MKRFSFYVLSGPENIDLKHKVLALCKLSVNKSIGKQEPRNDVVLNTPRWRQLYELILPDGIDEIAVAIIRQDPEIQILVDD